MKKTFQLTHAKIKPARLAESARSDARKYLKRERRRPLPEGVDFWDFDCKFGPNAEHADVIHLSEISSYIGQAEQQQLESFYLEILAKPGRRSRKPQAGAPGAVS